MQEPVDGSSGVDKAGLMLRMSLGDVFLVYHLSSPQKVLFSGSLEECTAFMDDWKQTAEAN